MPEPGRITRAGAVGPGAPGGQVRPSTSPSRARLAGLSCILSIGFVTTAVALFMSGAGPIEDFGGPDAVAAVSFSIVGALIVWKRPGNRIGWLFTAVGPISGLYCLADAWGRITLVSRPGSLPGGAWAAWIAAWSWIPSAYVILSFLPLLFPDGRLRSARWRPVAWLCVTSLALLLLGAMLGPIAEITQLPAANPLLAVPIQVDALDAITSLSFLASALAGLAALLVRFLRARGDERQQLKWFLLGSAVAVLGAFASPYPVLGAVSVLAIPVAAGVAILRYRLYDIDRILNRTLVYGTLTALLALIYIGAVFVLGPLLGGGSELAVAAATLAVAAAFQPVKRRVQATVDRRFSRRRYDAARTVEAFSARLRAAIDLDTLGDELLGVVDQTVEPTQASLWLRPWPATTRREAGP